MSIYSDISRELGSSKFRWVDVPSLEAVTALKENVLKGDAAAFKKVFEFHRFAQPAKNQTEQKIKNINYEAFLIGQEKFK